MIKDGAGCIPELKQWYSTTTKVRIPQFQLCLSEVHVLLVLRTDRLLITRIGNSDVHVFLRYNS